MVMHSMNTLSGKEDSGQVQSGLGLQSSRTSERLNQVDRVRANGVGDHIALPQLVVCGDQSAGKSSVLEGISGIPFPRQDGLCTRFATEIILRHQPGEQRTTATIIPNVSRAEDEKARLSAFHRDITDFAGLPDLITDAAVLMNVEGFGEFADSSVFAADVLRLEIVGNTGLHLTLVDLPGLISVSENEQDVQLVGDLVNSYLENSRTIILAVVPASSDVDTQSIIQRARRFDKDGLRTVGIITKPDLINDGAEHRVAKLANNADKTKLKLGFFLLKNPKPVELEKGMTMSQRRQAELEFFASPRWKTLGLDSSRVGIDNLRTFMQDLLNRHIERELPKVRKDVTDLLNKTNAELVDLGAERNSPAQIRMYLTRISTDFHNLVKAGVEGIYSSRDGFFHEIDDQNEHQRLRAAVHKENGDFSNYMRTHGKKRRVVSSEHLNDMESESGQLLITTEDMSLWIKKIYHRTRGRELPGNYNHSLLAELFHEQSTRWADISRSHVEKVVDLVSRFVHSVSAFVIKDTDVRENVLQYITVSMENNAKAACSELAKLLEDEAGSLITYNHYYTDNIQKARNDRSRQDLSTSLRNTIDDDWNGRFHVSNSTDEIKRLVTSLQNHGVIVNMEERACSEAQTDLDAYYKVAMKTFVDNVCRQVIERHIVAKLPTVFSPVTVSGYSEEDLSHLAAESPQLSKRRVEASQLREALEDSLRELR
ncbi:putative dynamin GTPase [Aspergillus affinis]|uniref:putative dynamin GTPase n=1 Tax=Aspergillus affinis TaxID=1070780 RepID=UPI0022FDC7EC|nr:interferon-induced GTP-binding protein Mx1 [Aspergillus affinis]KAI9040408.1 interferon-induced GTP-binding protein Mx1 [Aspergillus affinis]